jgi:hypothetical protein
MRRAAFDNDRTILADPVASYVDKVHRHAYKIVDREVQQLYQAGLDDDQVFELTVAAALGSGLARLDAARRAAERRPGEPT